MELLLQPASSEDADYACRLTRSNMQVYYQRYALQLHVARWHRGWDELENYLLLDQGRRMGFMSLSVEPGSLYLRDIHVERPWQGKGVGSWAMGQLRTMAVNAGIEQVRLKVFRDNPARFLYQRLGFEVVGEEDYLLRMECVV